MTYKEFKENVEELGLRCKFYDYGVSVCLMDCDYHLATIYNTIKYFGIISFSPSLSNITNNDLLYWCYDLIRTPLENRGELE